MAKTVVLLQVRDEPEAQEQERLCFLESSGLEPEELETVNLVEDPALSWRKLSEADAVMIGGAGAHSATHRYPFTDPLESVVHRIVDEGKPMFASCFGHHFLVQALGGDLETDHHRGEIGTFDIELTTSGRSDPLLSSFPADFAVQLGHHDVVVNIPDRVQELAFSEKCRYQMLRVVGKPVYSTQFHPEMSEQHLQTRLEMYRHSYLADQTADEEVSLPLRPSTWADKLLSRFLDLYT